MSWLTNIIVTVLLFFNAVAILNEKRFLKKCTPTPRQTASILRRRRPTGRMRRYLPSHR
jgi:hypothetical protein